MCISITLTMVKSANIPMMIARLFGAAISFLCVGIRGISRSYDDVLC